MKYELALDRIAVYKIRPRAQPISKLLDLSKILIKLSHKIVLKALSSY